MTRERPPQLWREELKRAYVELRGARVTPLRGALSVALGLWVGSIPAFGLHTPVVLALCLWLRLDGLLAWVASNVSNPFFAPFLVMGEVQVGAYVMTGAPLDYFDVNAARETGVAGVLLYAFVGSPFVATVIAVLGQVVVYAYLRIYRRYAPPASRRSYALPEHAPAWWGAAERVARRMAPEAEGRTRFHAARIELMADPRPTRWAKALGEGGHASIVGAHAARAALALLELGVVGSAWAQAHDVGAAEAAARAPSLPIELEPSSHVTIPGADAVLLLETLSERPLSDQDALIREAAAAVRPKGRLLVEAFVAGRGFGSWVARIRGRHLRPAASLAKRIEAEGFTTEVDPAGLGRVLVRATRT